MEEEFVAFRGGVKESAQVRSTVLVSSIQSLRTRGLGERYEGALAPEDREAMMGLTPGTWLPIETAVRHYEAVGRLDLDAPTVDALGREVASRLYKSTLAMLVKLSAQAGIDPWSVFSIAHRINDMSWRGTDVAVWKLGPKEARYDWRHIALARVPYFATSFGTFMESILQMFCTKAYVRLVPRRCTATSLAYVAQWA